jgi:hypothetical protein
MPDHTNKNIDIWSKGDVVSHLDGLMRSGQVRPCKSLQLEHGHLGAFYPRCKKDWAQRVPAKNVYTDVTAYSAPSGYSWPKCPDNCPHFEQSEDFLLSASRDQYDQEAEAVVGLSIDDHESLSELEMPDKITIPWLVKHVEVKHWIAVVVFAAAIFVLGVQASRLSLVREMFGLDDSDTTVVEE